MFEHFRNAIYEEHGVDCLHHPTLPSLSFDMALKHTNAQIGLMTDPEMYLMIKNSMRGGIATISHRHSKANNPLVENFDDTDKRRYIIYLDANSLYATAQSQSLTVGDFRFLDDEEIRRFELNNIEPDGEVVYFVECDLEYPTHLRTFGLSDGTRSSYCGSRDVESIYSWSLKFE